MAATDNPAFSLVDNYTNTTYHAMWDPSFTSGRVQSDEARKHALYAASGATNAVAELAASKMLSGCDADQDGDADPKATNATGNVAGGSFSPAGCWIPDTLAIANHATFGVTPSPATAWTVGQYVVLGDDSHAYWDGTDWLAGEAPA